MTATEHDVKTRILLAAKKLFAAQGYDRTSIRQICEAADANVALVSYHFGGKEQLFYSLFATFLPNRLIQQFSPEQMDPVAGLRYVIEGITTLRLSDPQLISIMQQEIALMSERVEVIREHAFPIWRKLRQLLENGRNQGLFHFRSLDHTLLMVLGTVFIHKQKEYFAPLMTEGEASFEDVVEDTLHFILCGLGYVRK
ncbi:TetR family transcriptional regulator [Marinicrinis lubricantis]|uniref:TetR family transcriptional regulator n=1 Tax=Marinicrinis lubricantis TaxID=2086470 RepID=A0ABW1IKD7_9BACL